MISVARKQEEATSLIRFFFFFGENRKSDSPREKNSNRTLANIANCQHKS